MGAAIGVDPETGATIETNKDDYQPGEVVHLDGHGWAPGETVSLAMSEEPNTHEDVHQEVQADGDGRFSIHFYDVQQHDLGVTFTLTATGQTSGSVATAVFTDNIPPGQITITLDGGAPPLLNVAPGATISLEVTATVLNNGGAPTNWNSTGWVLTTSTTTPPGRLTHCVDTDDAPGQAPSDAVGQPRTLNITAPVNPGTYHLWVALDEDNGTGLNACGGPVGQSVKRLFEGVVTVGAAQEAPTAVITAPTEADEGSTIPLSGSNSTDDGTVDSYQWSIVSFDNPDGGTCEFAGGGTTATGVTTSVECDDNGSLVISLVVTDDDDLSSTPAQATITVNNVDPTVVIAPDSRTIDEGGSAAYTATITDPGTNDTHTTFSWTSTIGVCTPDAGATNTAASFTCTDNGTGTVKLEVTDDDNGTGDDTAGLTVNNVPPNVTAPADATINEGDTFSAGGSFTDPGTDTWTATVDYGDGAGAVPLSLSSKSFNLSHQYTDDGTYTIIVTVTDDDGASDTDDVVVTVANVVPNITTVTVPLNPIAAGTPVNVSWSFTGADTDTFTCDISWDIGQAFEGAGNATGKTCSATKTLAAGIYTVTVKVTDDDLSSDTETATTYIVVYDPSAGFVTGGGWINSPVGALVADPYLTGKANFGFVSKYQKGATTPSGNTEFQFHAGDLNFKSNSYEWLVVMGAGRAQYKGVGTINGAGDYGFLLTAIDGSYDKFRIKIWNRATSAVVYDNQMGQLEDSPAATTIGGGSIVIHAK